MTDLPSNPPDSDPPKGAPSAAPADSCADVSVWDAVERCYVQEGCSSKILADRFGLKDRTVREHAQRGGWRARREQRRAAAAPPRLVDDAVAEALAEQRKARQIELLMDPTVAGSLIYIAGLIQNALVRGALHEMRLLQKAFADFKRQAADLDRAFNGGLDPADILRRAHMAELLAVSGKAADPPPSNDAEAD